MHIINWISFAIYFISFLPIYSWADLTEKTPQIEWRVENPFPFVNDSNAYLKLKEGLANIKQNGSFDTYSSAVEYAYKKTMWDSYTSTYDRSLVHGKVTYIQARVSSSSSGDVCIWRGLHESNPVPCDKWHTIPIELNINDNLSVDVRSETHDQYSLSTTATVTKKIILGLGDSFSSGEGNPDRQSRWDESRIPNDKARFYQRNWPLFYEPSEYEQADWNDVKCHRSLYNWQFLHALNQAGNDPHKMVVFISFACSGAEIYDGLLVQQRVTLRDQNEIRTKAYDSQVNQAVDLLCRVNTFNREYMPARKHLIASRQVSLLVKECPPSDFVKPDEILLTIGGNDVGFGGLIAWTAFPSKGRSRIGTKLVSKINKELELKAGMICPERNIDGDDFCNPYIQTDMSGVQPSKFVAKDAFTTHWLKDNLIFAHKVLQDHLQVLPQQIVQLTYPSPTSDENGKTCTFDQSAVPSIALKNELFSPINNTLGVVGRIWLPKLVLKKRYDLYSIGPTQVKLGILERGVVNELQTTIQSASSEGVKVIDVSSPFKVHGYCAKSSKYELEMPTKDGQGSNSWRWWPADQAPKLQNAWKVVNRWFRTPNDAQLGMFYDSFYKEKGWTGGILHPNHLGHFSMFSTLNTSEIEVAR